jgi:hypothetical protein
MVKVLAFVLGSVMCLACQAQSVPRNELLTADQLHACKAKGGQALHVRFYKEACVWPTRDAGKACTDSAACEGICEAPWGTKMHAKVVGRCSKTAADARGGCSNEVTGGRAGGDICAE